ETDSTSQIETPTQDTNNTSHQRTLLNEIKNILIKTRKSLTPSLIAEKMLIIGQWKILGNKPIETISRVIDSDINDREDKSIFVKEDEDKYNLRNNTINHETVDTESTSEVETPLEHTLQDALTEQHTLQVALTEQPILHDALIEEHTLQDALTEQPILQESLVDDPALQETSDAEQTLQKTSDAEQTLQETADAEQTLQETEDVEQTLQTADLEKILQEMADAEQTLQEILNEKLKLQESLLADPLFKGKFSYVKCAMMVLLEAKKPLHFIDITIRALERGWLDTSQKNPDAIMEGLLHKEFIRDLNTENIPRFVKFGILYYGLQTS
ncbi:MAG: hypothetical protein LBF22_10365, partial [Deltaproteobacteria bacterium]|nr:hypothetical protein [Deltaproteobacteria bacterium]